MTKNNPAPPSLLNFRIAGSARIALPISDNSINKVLERSGSDLEKRNRSDSQQKGLNMKHTGTPTHLSIKRMVLTVILSVDLGALSKVVVCLAKPAVTNV